LLRHWLMSPVAGDVQPSNKGCPACAWDRLSAAGVASQQLLSTSFLRATWTGAEPCRSGQGQPCRLSAAVLRLSLEPLSP
jgi:hypothetical protein